MLIYVHISIARLCCRPYPGSVTRWYTVYCYCKSVKTTASSIQIFFFFWTFSLRFKKMWNCNNLIWKGQILNRCFPLSCKGGSNQKKKSPAGMSATGITSAPRLTARYHFLSLLVIIIFFFSGMFRLFAYKLQLLPSNEINVNIIKLHNKSVALESVWRANQIKWKFVEQPSIINERSWTPWHAMRRQPKKKNSRLHQPVSASQR